MYSKVAVDLIKKWEGFRAKPYYCSAGVATIGYGTTVYPSGERVNITDRAISVEMATNCLTWHIDRKVNNPLLRLINREKLTQNQYDALVSFVYNVGIGAFEKSTLRRLILENPNNPDIEQEFLKWCKAKGKRVEGLYSRRVDEAELYFSTS